MMHYDKEYIKTLIPMTRLFQIYSMEYTENKNFPCPFHDEKDPSASIKNNFFYCYGCHCRHDIFSFVMAMENCSFSKAVEFLAKLSGVAKSSKTNINRLVEQRKKEQEEKERKKKISEAKYSFLACMARVYRNLDVEWISNLDFLLNAWLYEVPEWVSVNNISIYNRKEICFFVRRLYQQNEVMCEQ